MGPRRCARGGVLAYGGALPQLQASCYTPLASLSVRLFPMLSEADESSLAAQATCSTLLAQIRSSERTSLLTILLEGTLRRPAPGRTSRPTLDLPLTRSIPAARCRRGGHGQDRPCRFDRAFVGVPFHSARLAELDARDERTHQERTRREGRGVHVSPTLRPRVAHSPSTWHRCSMMRTSRPSRSSCSTTSRDCSSARTGPSRRITSHHAELFAGRYVRIGPRFSNAVLQTLLTVVKKVCEMRR